MGSIFFHDKEKGFLLRFLSERELKPGDFIAASTDDYVPSGNSVYKRPGQATPEEWFADEDFEHFCTAEEVEDVTERMGAPEVSIGDKVPQFILDNVGACLEDDMRGYFIVPEEEETRWFAVFGDHLKELGRTDVDGHADWLRHLAECDSGAVTVEMPDGSERRFRLENSVSFNEFGSRLFVQFFEEGRYTYEESVAQRMSNVRLMNKLKPASSLTAKNERDIAAVAVAHNCEEALLRSCVSYGIMELTDEQIAGVRHNEKALLDLLHSLVVPRKMIAQALSDVLHCEFADLEDSDFREEVVMMLDRDWCEEHQAVPWTVKDGTLQVAMMNPLDKETIAAIEEKTKSPVKAYCSSAQDIYALVRRVHQDYDGTCQMVF